MTEDTHDTTGEASERESDTDGVSADSAESPEPTEGDTIVRDDTASRSTEEAVVDETSDTNRGGDEFEETDEDDEDEIPKNEEEYEEDEVEEDEDEYDRNDTESTDASSESGRFGGGVDRYVLWGGLLLSGLLGTVAAVNLYFQVGRVIDVWIAGRYQPIFQAGFNLVVLLVAGYVAVRIADRLEVRG